MKSVICDGCEKPCQGKSYFILTNKKFCEKCIEHMNPQSRGIIPKEVALPQPPPEPVVDDRFGIYGDIVGDALALPDRMEAWERKVFTLTRRSDAINKQIKEIEGKLFLEIFKEKDKEGKNKFSNDAMRQAELLKRSHAHKEHKVFRIDRDKTIEEIHNAKSKLENLRNKLRVLQIAVDVLKIRTRIV